LITVLPKAFSSPKARKSFAASEYIKKQIYMLIRVFNKLGRREFSLVESNTSRGLSKDHSDPILDSLEAAIKIRSEFRENGLYFRKKKLRQFSKTNYPINWPLTIKNRQPFLDDNEIFYNSTIHNSRKHDLKHPLSDLHLSCLREILKLVGDNSIKSLPESSMGNSISSRKNIVKFIKDISHDVFDERGKRLSKLLQVYLGVGRLNLDSVEKRDDLLAYTANFEIVWEDMLRSLFDAGGIRDLPSGEWFAYPYELNSILGITPRIDGRLMSEEYSAYFDAKDYPIKKQRLFGSSSDHYKQIIYRLLTDTKRPDNFFNILAFPGVGQKDLFEIHGCHKWLDIPNSEVFEIRIDYELVVSKWLGDSRIDMNSLVKKLMIDLKNFKEKIDQ
jgi:hypothetical protein